MTAITYCTNVIVLEFAGSVFRDETSAILGCLQCHCADLCDVIYACKECGTTTTRIIKIEK